MKEKLTLSLEPGLIKTLRILSFEEYGKSRYLSDTIEKLLREALRNRVPINVNTEEH